MATQLQISSPKVSIHNGKAVTTTEDVACYFGKQHHHVVQKLESLDCSEQFTIRNFSRMVKNKSIGSGAEREIVYYEMTRNGFIFLVMGFTGKKAAAFKEAYIAEFDRMEAELHKPVVSTPGRGSYSIIVDMENDLPVCSRVLMPGEHVMTFESSMEQMKHAGLIVVSCDEIGKITMDEWLSLAEEARKARDEWSERYANLEKKYLR